MSDFLGGIGDFFGDAASWGGDFIHGVGLDAVADPSAVGGGFDAPSGDSGFFGDLLKGITSPSSISRLLGAGIGVAGNTIGANTAANATNQAALITAAANAAAQDKALAAQKEARDIMIQRSDRGIGAIDAGLADYTKTTNPLLTTQPITIPQYRGMTPQQQIGFDDLTRNGMAAISAGGLRGAGRAGVGAVMDQQRRYRADVAAQNDADTRAEMRRAQGVSNTARQGLGTAQLQTGGAKANTELMTGSGLANSLQAGGNTAAQFTANTGASNAAAARDAGFINANATFGDANILGKALSGLGAVVADRSQSYSPQNPA